MLLDLRSRALFACLTGALALGCGPLAESDELEARGRLEGVDGSVDSSDRACHLVLRSVSRGLSADGTRFVWHGEVDLSTAAHSEGLSPEVLFQSSTQPGWRSVSLSAAAEGEAPSGFVRFSFALEHGLPTPGMSGTSLSRARVELIPYLTLAGGGRLFDHNRSSDDFSNYVLDANNGFSIGDDPAACPGQSPRPELAPTILRFHPDFTHEASGPLFAGHDFEIHYALERLPDCRGTHNGHPAWSLEAHARFLPSGATAQGQLRAFESNLGVPTSVARSVPLRVTVPEGTERVELWFSNSTGAGSSCLGFDSRFGENYGFEVHRAPVWMGNTSVKITRAGGHPCGSPDAAAMTTGFSYGTWARQRSVFGNACLEVYTPGQSDANHPELWRVFDARVYYRFSPSEPFRFVHLGFVDRAGNNARFALDLAGLDPFRHVACPEVPVTVGPQYREARMEFLFFVNGRWLGQADGAPFVGTYEDYANPSCL